MVKLSLLERLVLTSSLPKTGGAVEFSLKADILEKIKLTQEDIEKYEIKDLPNGGGVRFNSEGKTATFEINFTETEFGFIKNHLKNLDAKKTLTDNTYRLFKIFC